MPATRSVTEPTIPGSSTYSPTTETKSTGIRKPVLHGAAVRWLTGAVRGYVGTIVFLDEAVLLVQDRDFFTHEPLWTLPSGGIEDGESPAVAAARELAEESGCRIDPYELELIATSEVRQDGRQVSQSWNFTAIATDPHLEPTDPDGAVVDARWFERTRAIELLALHRYDPIREPAIRFLNGGRGLHWTFELTDHTGDRPTFRWHPPEVPHP